MNMFKETKSTTVKQYLANVPENRKSIIKFMHGFIQKAAPGMKPYFASNMLGYGKFKCTDYKKQEIG